MTSTSQHKRDASSKHAKLQKPCNTATSTHLCRQRQTNHATAGIQLHHRRAGWGGCCNSSQAAPKHHPPPSSTHRTCAASASQVTPQPATHAVFMVEAYNNHVLQRFSYTAQTVEKAHTCAASASPITPQPAYSSTTDDPGGVAAVIAAKQRCMAPALACSAKQSGKR